VLKGSLELQTETERGQQRLRENQESILRHGMRLLVAYKFLG
jgi:hypothetical protein